MNAGTHDEAHGRDCHMGVEVYIDDEGCYGSAIVGAEQKQSSGVIVRV